MVKSLFYWCRLFLPVTDSFHSSKLRVKWKVCILRAGIVTNCRKCKSSVRYNGCPARKKMRVKTYVNVKKRGGAAIN